jgi:hypothetical protein
MQQILKKSIGIGLIGLLTFVFAGMASAADYQWPRRYMLG